MLTIQNLNFIPDGPDILLRHGHVTYFSLLRVNTILINQHEFFQHGLSSLTISLENSQEVIQYRIVPSNLLV